MSVKKLLIVAGCLFLVAALCSVGAYIVSRSDSTSTTPAQTQERDSQAAGGEAYKALMRTKLNVLGYKSYSVTGEVENGKFEVEANGKIGKCPIEVKWVVGVLTAAEQAAPTVKPGINLGSVKIKLDEVYNTKKGKLQKYTALSTINPTPADISKELGKRNSPCKP